MMRSLFRMRLPLALFLIIILALGLASFGIFYNTFVSHVHGDYFKLETKYLELDFPRNWFAVPWEESNISGDRYGLLLAPPDLRASMYITVYDENAARTYLEQNDVTDAFSLNMLEVDRLYNWTLENNENATLYFIENSTRIVSGYVVDSTNFMIGEGYIDDEGNAYNWTWTFMSFVDSKMFQVAYHGIEEDYDLAHEDFQSILSATEIKE